MFLGYNTRVTAVVDRSYCLAATPPFTSGYSTSSWQGTLVQIDILKHLKFMITDRIVRMAVKVKMCLSPNVQPAFDQMRAIERKPLHRTVFTPWTAMFIDLGMRMWLLIIVQKIFYSLFSGGGGHHLFLMPYREINLGNMKVLRLPPFWSR